MTKYNLSDIMTRAHALRRNGYSMSDALRAAWLEAKLNHIENRRFFISMQDRWGAADFEADRQLSLQQHDLRQQLSATIKPQSPSARVA